MCVSVFNEQLRSKPLNFRHHTCPAGFHTRLPTPHSSPIYMQFTLREKRTYPGYFSVGVANDTIKMARCSIHRRNGQARLAQLVSLSITVRCLLSYSQMGAVNIANQGTALLMTALVL